jgi:acyl transferase domain-containing protein/acyl carrier protein
MNVLTDLKELRGKINKDSREPEAIEVESVSRRDVAIIGLSCRFSSANNKDEYWEMLMNGQDGIRSFPETRQKDNEEYLAKIGKSKDERKYYQGGFLNQINTFDYEYFGISPTEARLMSPNQRLFLEIAWNAIEDAGYGGLKLHGTKTGVYLGNSTDFGIDYHEYIKTLEPELAGISIPGNINSIIASRISYLLDLKGPSVLIDTACSSALVAVHYACCALRQGECELALAGSVKIDLLPLESIKNDEDQLGITSDDGRTWTFDDASNGTGLGEGVGVVVLKLLDKALEDGDHIYAVIKGSAVNQDGSSVGLTAPNSAAQTDLLMNAWQDAGIHPETISLIEAHGTGTKLGDPVEISGLQKAFHSFTRKKHFCAIGSVKTNIGHLDHAAGIAGLIKICLALQNKALPPSLHFTKPNRNINFVDSSVYVNDRLHAWEDTYVPRRAGVSAFGLSGTNCHLVLEEAPALSEEQNNPIAFPPFVLTISAKNKIGLINLVKEYRRFIFRETRCDLGSLCYTANTGRGHYSCRLAIIFSDALGLSNKLAKMQIENPGLRDQDVFYHEFHLVADKGQNSHDGYITKAQKQYLTQNAAAKVKEYFNVTDVQKSQILQEVCQIYVSGADINWEEFYQQQKYQKMSLPGYCFSKQRCWVRDLQEGINPGVSRTYYQLKWVKCALNLEKSVQNSSSWIMVLKGQGDLAVKIVNRIQQEERKIIEVEFGKEYQQRTDNKFTVGASEADFIQLLNEVKSRKISQIIYLFSLNDQATIDEIPKLDLQLQMGLYSLFHLTKAILACKIKEVLDIIIIAKNATEVDHQEIMINPHHAALFGLGQVIREEYPKLQCRCIEIDDHVDVETIHRELQSGIGTYHVAYRSSQRFVKELTEIVLGTIEDQPLKIKAQGLYVITGGSGGIGLEIGRYLASKNNINLVLVNRSQLPERENWDEIIHQGEDQRLIRKLKMVQEIEALGTKVITLSADISNEKKLAALFAKLRSSYGRIHGIIHAAGIAGDGFILRKNMKQFQQVISPKIQGTFILDRLTRQDKPDFMIFCSSITAFLADAGQSDYTAANSYLDSYAAFRTKMGFKTLAVNWPAWQEVGMAVDYGVDQIADLVKSIVPNQAIAALDTVVNKQLTNIIIGELNQEMVATKEDQLFFRLSNEIKCRINSDSAQIKKVVLNNNQLKINQFSVTETNQSYDDAEAKITRIWLKVLGLPDIDTGTSFNDLGGNSILATLLLKETEKEFPGIIDISDIYSYPSIVQLAKYINNQLNLNQYQSLLNPEDLNDPSRLEIKKLIRKLKTNEISIDSALMALSTQGVKKYESNE